MKKYILLLITFALFACATPMKSTQADMQKVSAAEGIVVGSIALYAMPFAPNEDQSKGWFKPAQTSDAVFSIGFHQRKFLPEYFQIELKANNEEYFVRKLPPGTYSFTNLAIAKLRFPFTQTFTVEAGKTTYIGRHGFVLPARLIVGSTFFSGKRNELEKTKLAITAEYPEVAKNLKISQEDEVFYKANASKEAIYNLIESSAIGRVPLPILQAPVIK